MSRAIRVQTAQNVMSAADDEYVFQFSSDDLPPRYEGPAPHTTVADE